MYYCFVSQKGGGAEGTEWAKFVIKHTEFVTPSLRSMTAEMFQVLADFPWLYLAYAILLTAYTCPAKFAKGKMCTWIDDKHVERLGNTKDVAERAKLAAADAFLVQVATDLEDFPELPALGIWKQVSADVRTRKETQQAKILIAGQLDCAVGAWVLKKIKTSADKVSQKKQQTVSETASVADESEVPDNEEEVGALTKNSSRG